MAPITPLPQDTGAPLREVSIHMRWNPSAIDSDSLKPLSVSHSKLKFEW